MSDDQLAHGGKPTFEAEQFSADPWVSEESPEQEATALALLEVAWRRLDDIDTYLSGPTMKIDPGSSLALDARHLGPYRGGGLYRSALNSSFDALRTVRLILDREDRTYPMSGLYPLLRAGLENAALAAYLLGPKERDERLLRAWNEIAGEVRLQHKFSSHFDIERADTRRERWRTEINELLRSRPSVERTATQLRQEQISAVVDEADAIVRSDPASVRLQHAMPLLAIWQLLSGLSHGRHWAAFTALARSSPVPTVDDNIVTVQMTTRAGVVSMALLRAVMTLETAIHLHAQRARVWLRQPEDAEEAITSDETDTKSGDQ